jgi:hypothetical protein
LFGCAQVFDDVETVTPGQHDIQDHEVQPSGHVKSALQQTSHPRLVFRDQHPHVEMLGRKHEFVVTQAIRM